MSMIFLDRAALLLTAYIQKDVAVFLHGPPGIGKSQVVHQTAKALKMGLIDMRLSIRDPVDLRGLPLIDAKTKTTLWLPPAELPNEKRDGKKGILFLDEMNTANQSMQAAAMGLVLDRKLGDYRLPPGWVPVAAGNRLADRAVATRMGTALRNRFAHIEVGVDVDAWTAWAHSVGINPVLIAFMKFRPGLLHIMPTGDDNSFPTPRSWEQVAKFLDATVSIRQGLIAGLVGEGPAAELTGFINTWTRMPNLKEILTDPKRAKVPKDDEPSIFFGLAVALAAKADQKTFANILEYGKRMPKEFEVMMVNETVKKSPDLMKTQSYTNWAIKNEENV